VTLDYTPEQFSKLPKYAQNRIVKLEQDLAAAHRRLAEGPEDSRVFLDPSNRTPRPLGVSPTVRFYPHGRTGDYIDVRVDEPGFIAVRTSGHLLLSTVASNGVEVRSVQTSAVDELDHAAAERARLAEDART
jgi:hypothetical protein